MPRQPASEPGPSGAGHVDINHADINNVRPKIRQVVREGFKFAEAIAALNWFGKVMAGLAAHEWFLGTASTVPLSGQ